MNTEERLRFALENRTDDELDEFIDKMDESELKFRQLANRMARYRGYAKQIKYDRRGLSD